MWPRSKPFRYEGAYRDHSIFSKARTASFRAARRAVQKLVEVYGLEMVLSELTNVCGDAMLAGVDNASFAHFVATRLEDAKRIIADRVRLQELEAQLDAERNASTKPMTRFFLVKESKGKWALVRSDPGCSPIRVYHETRRAALASYKTIRNKLVAQGARVTLNRSR